VPPPAAPGLPDEETCVGRELTGDERRALLAEHREELARLATEAGIDMPMVRRYVLAERLPLEWYQAVADGAALESPDAIQLQAPREVGLDPTALRGAIWRFVRTIGQADVPTVVIHHSAPYAEATAAVLEAMRARSADGATVTLDDEAAAVMARGSLQAADRIRTQADDVAQAFLLLERYDLDRFGFFGMMDFNRVPETGEPGLLENLRSLLTYCTQYHEVDIELFDSLARMQRGAGMPEEAGLHRLDTLCMDRGERDTILLQAIFSMQEGRGILSEDEQAQLEDQSRRASGTGRVERDVLLDIARLRRGHGVMDNAEFDRTVQLCTSGSGRFDPDVFHFFVGRHVGMGSVDQGYVDRIVGLCTTEEGHLDWGVMQAIAALYGSRNATGIPMFESLLEQCIDGQGRADQLLLRAASAVYTDLGSSVSRSFERLLASCTDADQRLNRSLLAAVIENKEVNKGVHSGSPEQARGLLSASTGTDGQLDPLVFALLADMGSSDRAGPAFAERLRTLCSGSDGSVDWQAVQATAQAYHTTSGAARQNFDEMLTRCTRADGRADVLLVRALGALNRLPVGHYVGQGFERLLASCSDEVGQLNRGVLRDVIEHAEAQDIVYRTPPDVGRRLLNGSIDGAGRLDTSVFQLLAGMEDRSGDDEALSIDRLRTLCTDAEGQLNWQTLHAVAAARDVLSGFYPAVFDALLTSCVTPEDRLDVLRVRALETLRAAPHGRPVTQAFERLLAVCADDDGQPNRSLLEDVIGDADVYSALYNLPRPEGRQALDGATNGEGRLDASVFRMLAGMQSAHVDGGMQAFIDRLHALSVDNAGRVDWETMQAIAQAYEKTSLYGGSQFIELLTHCTDGQGRIDRLLLQAASTMKTPFMEGLGSAFATLLTSCSMAGGVLDRGLLEAVIGTPAFRSEPATRENIARIIEQL
jgi:hypothetical protein